jgi:hypothetical protein
MDKEQQRRMKAVVEEKKEQARAASEATSPDSDGASKLGGDQPSLTDSDRPQDVASPRAKGTGKGKKTADKWNQ